ncbi:MAG: hypothetical protein DHS20C17_05950 [Cyclobacteriaceae bacterium]|nr:MAG: hypothetical protein DHS20C17_05950 [Cyclobacteriaceae bacterium]
MIKKVKDYLEQLNLIYYAFIGLPLVLFSVVYLPLKDGLIDDALNQGNSISYFTAGLLLFVVLYFARRLFRRNLKVITIEWSFNQKLKAYRKISIIFYGFGLFSSLVSIGLLLITKNQLFVATYPILLLVLSLYRPTIERLKKELPLTEKELSMVNHKGQITDNIMKHNN